MFAALLLLLAQNVPAGSSPAEAVETEEVVVQAKLGLTTMLFDKGSDGRLRNCRVMVSSGSQKRDTAACQATPVCYAKTADQVTDCRALGLLELAAAAVPEARPAGAGAPQAFTLPKLNDDRPKLADGQAGPLGLQEPSRETERQRVVLPPLPKAPSNGPVVRFGPAQEAGE
ncbi:hypothetical protein FHS95_001645 [Sphingomonas naasensis]|uniref:UrcA family protein n=1 Tax=Sphingomonas naasensis TaxID=1344951 RepID=A0A4S1W5J4_9SPHN|nr:hypothetical protein [Sphingomonas naasensis]NIJ19976.1 hypothetical protein [Sphingomonas naasensis]TGX37929.1 hypothetical protein E5A74_19355 [Sphingomonas naasensis]